jgi:hypothetical protein
MKNKLGTRIHEGGRMEKLMTRLLIMLGFPVFFGLSMLVDRMTWKETLEYYSFLWKEGL